jgi:D-arabinan exo alpha-(1,3)/(1,5)-arabinofuranosidase (non-reducing end)
MKTPRRSLSLALVSASLSLSPSQAPSDSTDIDPVLLPLLDFHPGWVTRSVTSHDPKGGNGDGSGNGIPMEDGYRVLFHGKGEGRIVRLWMTADRARDVPRDYAELWIQIDGETAYRGNPVDFFEGRGPFQAPLVLGYGASSQAFLSYAPFAYLHEAKILFKSDPHYFQVTYRQGPGSSDGPNAAQITAFASDPAWHRAAPPPLAIDVSPGHPFTVARGPVVLSSLSLRAKPEDWCRLSVRIGAQAPVPAAFFFGLGSSSGWVPMKSALSLVDPGADLLMTRLPIPLPAGEALKIESSVPLRIGGASSAAKGRRSAARLTTQYREQMGPGTETTMPFFETSGPTELVSLVEEIQGDKPGDRTYLEGDEMIRTDQMRYPFQLGTGTEDYFNGGWYFRGVHENPFSGLPRFVVIDPGDDWSHARFSSSLYRHHVLDPIVGRTGIRFGFEAGPTGAFQPVRYRTLALGYTFDAMRPLATVKLASSFLGPTVPIESAVDAEASQPRETCPVRYSRSRTVAQIACPERARGLFLVRTYDAGVPDQEAVIRIEGRDAGRLFEAYANTSRRLAEDALWIPLREGECRDGWLSLEIDPTASKGFWSDIAYKLAFHAER